MSAQGWGLQSEIQSTDGDVSSHIGVYIGDRCLSAYFN